MRHSVASGGGFRAGRAGIDRRQGDAGSAATLYMMYKRPAIRRPNPVWLP